MSQCALCDAVALYRYKDELRCKRHRDTLQPLQAAERDTLDAQKAAWLAERNGMAADRAREAYARKLAGRPMLQGTRNHSPEVGRHRAGAIR